MRDPERLEDLDHMLEECGLAYEVRLVNIGKGEQFTPEFLAISPNNRMPAIVDPMGPTVKRLASLRSRAPFCKIGRVIVKCCRASAEERARLRRVG